MTDTMSPADIKAITNGNNDGFSGNGGWFWIVILFLFVFSGWGRGGFGGGMTGGGVTDGYVLASDMARVQQTITTGLCDGFYNQAQQTNGVNMNLANGFAGVNANMNTQGYETRNAINGIGTQLAQCCCDNKAAIADVKYAMAMNSNAETNAINQGFCQTNFNASTNTRDLLENQNANTRAILDALNAQQMAAKDAQIAQQTQQIFGLQLAASQAAQNQYLIQNLNPCPIPAYTVPNPYAARCGCGC